MENWVNNFDLEKVTLIRYEDSKNKESFFKDIVSYYLVNLENSFLDLIDSSSKVVIVSSLDEKEISNIIGMEKFEKYQYFSVNDKNLISELNKLKHSVILMYNCVPGKDENVVQVGANPRFFKKLHNLLSSLNSGCKKILFDMNEARSGPYASSICDLIYIRNNFAIISTIENLGITFDQDNRSFVFE